MFKYQATVGYGVAHQYDKRSAKKAVGRPKKQSVADTSEKAVSIIEQKNQEARLAIGMKFVDDIKSSLDTMINMSEDDAILHQRDSKRVAKAASFKAICHLIATMENELLPRAIRDNAAIEILDRAGVTKRISEEEQISAIVKDSFDDLSLQELEKLVKIKESNLQSLN